MIIIKVPIESSEKSKGCKRAGNEIIAQLEEKHVSESGKQIEKASLRFEEIHLNNENLLEAHKLIYKNSLDEISSNEKTIFIGGDHSLTFSTVMAFKDVCESEDKTPFLIIFDAHADCGIIKSEIPNNFQWLRKLIDNGFPNEKIILIGLRKSSVEENKFLNENKVRVYHMRDLNEFEEICDIVMELANKNQIYVSVDIDVVDSAFVPGTVMPESGGLTSRQLIYFLQRLNLLKGLRVVDIVEVNPEKDINSATVKLGAKILGEMIG